MESILKHDIPAGTFYDAWLLNIPTFLATYLAITVDWLRHPSAVYSTGSSPPGTSRSSHRSHMIIINVLRFTSYMLPRCYVYYGFTKKFLFFTNILYGKGELKA